MWNNYSPCVFYYLWTLKRFVNNHISFWNSYRVKELGLLASTFFFFPLVFDLDFNTVFVFCFIAGIKSFFNFLTLEFFRSLSLTSFRCCWYTVWKSLFNLCLDFLSIKNLVRLCSYISFCHSKVKKTDRINNRLSFKLL